MIRSIPLITEISLKCLFIFVNRLRRVSLITPFGESPFMESWKEAYKDLLDDGYIELEENKFS